MDLETEPNYFKENPHAGTEEELQKKIRKAYYRFKLTENSNSLLKEVLNHDVYHAYKDKKTKFGGSFWNVIQAGATYINEPIGLFASDPDAYSVFKPLFNIAIDEIHLGFSQDDVQPTHTWGYYKGMIRNPDPTGEYIESTRIRLCRNLVGYPFSSCLTRTLLKDIESKIVPVLREMPCGLDGRYFPLEKLREEIQKELRDEHVLWKMPSKYMQAANVGRFWPSGRGIFMNKARNFFVWVGKDDHLRIISTSKGHNLREVYERLVRGTMVLENNLDFVHDDRLGYLTFDPANLGTTLRASYLIRLPRLTEVGLVEKFAEEFRLEVRGMFGARLPVHGGLYNISNKRRLGVTEFEAVMEFQLGITKLIIEEQKLEKEFKHRIIKIASTLSDEMSKESNKTRNKNREQYLEVNSNTILEEKESSSSSACSSSISLDYTKEKDMKICVKEEERESINRSVSEESKNIDAVSSVSSASSESSASSQSVVDKRSAGKQSNKFINETKLNQSKYLFSKSTFTISDSSVSTKSDEKEISIEISANKFGSTCNDVGKRNLKSSSNSSPKSTFSTSDSSVSTGTDDKRNSIEIYANKSGSKCNEVKEGMLKSSSSLFSKSTFPALESSNKTDSQFRLKLIRRN